MAIDFARPNRRALSVLVFLLAAVSVVGAQQLVCTPFHANGIYKLGEAAGWSIAAGPDATVRQFTYIAKKNNQETIQQGRLDLASGPARLELRLQEPGMILVEIRAEAAKDETEEPSRGKKKEAPALLLGAAVAPEELKPVAERPADFDAFWQTKLKQLAAVPSAPELTKLESGDPAVELYRVKLASLGSHVQGFLARPVKTGKYPALLMYQSAGVRKMQPKKAVQRAREGWLAFDVNSHDMLPENDAGVPFNYALTGREDRESSYFLAMFLRDTRALNYIATREDWDGKTIVLNGSSMGGQQSLVTAALNPERVTALIVNEPAGADTNGDLHGRKAGYPYWPSKDATAMRTALYFDPVNFAPWIRAQSILSVGLIDTTAPPAGIWTVFNLIQAPKQIVPMVDAGHSNKTPKKLEAIRARTEEALEVLRTGGKLN
jgi:cephalosporin-C deacetylase-like acetyl esterase